MTLTCMDCGKPVYAKDCKPPHSPWWSGCGHSEHCSCASGDEDILGVEI